MAARFLSVDELTFLQVAERLRLQPVDMGIPLVRWRRTELERAVGRLENVEHSFSDPRLAARREEDEALADRIVRAVGARVSAIERQTKQSPPPTPTLMMSVKEAAKSMGIGHSTIYKLISDGRLASHRLGGRTLIKRADVEALFAEGPSKPTGQRGRPARW
jgi:excisionase family DNA binding protein